MTIHDTETLGSRSTHMSAWKQAPVLLKEADEAKLNRGNQKNPLSTVTAFLRLQYRKHRHELT